MQPPIGLPTDAVAHRVGTALSSYRVPYSFGATSNNGLRPDASLIDVNGTLYGTTYYGGAYVTDEGGRGTVFSFSTTG